VLRTVGLIGDDGGNGERRGVLRVRDGLDDWAAWVEMLRDSFGFMALDEASMMAVWLGFLGISGVVLNSYAQVGSLINKEARVADIGR